MRLCNEIDKIVKQREYEIARSVDIRISGGVLTITPGDEDDTPITLEIEGKKIAFPIPEDIKIAAVSNGKIRVNGNSIIVIFYGDKETCENPYDKIGNKRNVIIICDK